MTIQPFFHDRVRRLEELLEGTNAVFGAYNALDPDLGPALERMLDQAAATYRGLGHTATENEIRSLAAQFVSARRGVDPLTRQPVRSGRRALERSTALHALVHLGERLRSDWATSHQQLDDGARQVRALVMNALARGLLKVEELPRDPAGVEKLWRRMLSDAELRLACQQLGLQIHPMDVQLLLGDALVRLAKL